MIQGCLFDMDGLLLDTERVGLDAFKTIVAAYGMGPAEAEAFYISVIGTSDANTQEQVRATFPGVDVEAMSQAWYQAVDERMHAAVPLRPTVAETLNGLAARGVPMAVVTSTHARRARAHLDQAGLLSLFVEVIGGDQVSAPKPDPAPYIAGAAALGLRPENCAAFEDSDTGTRAAAAAGCAVWQIPDLRAPDQPFPDLGQSIATTLAEAVQAAGF